MTSASRCAGCGAQLPDGASFCPRCGRSAAPVLRELERLDVPATGAGGMRSEVLAQSGGHRPSRRGVVALGAAAVVLVGAVLLLAGGGGRGDGDAAASTTTRPSVVNTRYLYPSSTRPGETTKPPPPTTTRPPVTTTTSTTLVEFLRDPPGPVLGAEPGGLSLYAVGDGMIRRLELDTGRVTTRSLLEFSANWYGIDVAEGVVRVVGDVSLDVSLDLSDVRPFVDTRTFGYRVAGTGEMWSNDFEAFEPHVTLAGIDGSVSRYALPRGISLVGVVGDKALLQGGGRIATLDRHGVIHAYGLGLVIGTSPDWVLWWGCDELLRCAYYLGDTDRGSVRMVRLPDEVDSATVWGGEYGRLPDALSPDGRFAHLPSRDGAVLVDLATGRASGVSNGWPGLVTWSPDSRWLLRFDVNGGVEAVSTIDARVVRVLPEPWPNRGGQRVMGIG